MPPDSLEEELYRATNEIAAASERERDEERARVRHLEIIVHAAAQIMGVQACSPQTEEEAIDLAAKLHHVVEQRANCYGTQAADVARIQAKAERDEELFARLVKP